MLANLWCTKQMSSIAFYFLCMQRYSNDALLLQIARNRSWHWNKKKEKKRKKDITLKETLRKKEKSVKKETLTPTPGPHFIYTRIFQNTVELLRLLELYNEVLGITNVIKFSTSDNAIPAFWLVHCISVTSHYNPSNIFARDWSKHVTWPYS